MNLRDAVRAAVRYLRENWDIKLYGSLESGYHGWLLGELMRPDARLSAGEVLLLAREMEETVQETVGRVGATAWVCVGGPQ